MHPYFHLFGRTLPAYGTLAVTGGLVGSLPVLFLCKKRALDLENAAYLYALSVVGALFGAKILFFLVHLPLVKEVTFPYLLSGTSLTGGMAGAAISFSYWAKAFHVDRDAYARALTPAVPLALFFTRLGCLAAGCCYGIQTMSKFHVVFHDSLFAPADVPLVPAQPMEAAFHLLSFLVLFTLAVQEKDSAYNPLWYALGCCVYRFVSDFWRGDRGVLFPMGVSAGQLGAVLIGAAAFFAIQKRHKVLTDSVK